MGLILSIAVINICLGFTLAVTLGHRYQKLAANVPMLFTDVSAAAPTAVAAPVQPVEQAMPSASAAPAADRAAEPLAVAPNSEAAASLREAVATYQTRLDESDQQLRQRRDCPVADEIEACLNSLRQATDEYLAERVSGAQAIAAATPDSMRPTNAWTGFETAIHQQDEETQRARLCFDEFSAERDLAEQCRDLVTETARLLGANDRLRDAVNELDLELNRDQSAGQASRQTVGADGQVLDRGGLEAMLADHWRKDPHRVRKMGMALIDADQFGAVNQEHGHRVGDKVLAALTDLVAGQRREDACFGRISPQQYCLMLADADIRDAAQAAEKIRQSIELTRFVAGRSEIQVTVSCGVTETTSDDTLPTLFERAQAALREAKRYGRNRTFLHEGKYPAPVIPPNFALEERQVRVD